jgi:hypothetical protein
VNLHNDSDWQIEFWFMECGRLKDRKVVFLMN